MTEQTTLKVSDVSFQVKRQFGDEDAIQIGDADIISWINSAQRKIVATNPILQKTAYHDVTAGTQAYSFSSDHVQYIQSISYLGVPMEGYSYQEAQEYILKFNNASSVSTTPYIWWQWAQTIMLWPIPTATVVGALQLDYVAIPTDVVLTTDTLGVPDRYFDSIVEYVMMRAHLLDETFDGAQLQKSMFSESIGQLSEQENRMRLSSYPVITVREQDA